MIFHTQSYHTFYLNKYFEHFQHIVAIRFKKYDDHDEMENQK